jgi:hypothetical protein
MTRSEIHAAFAKRFSKPRKEPATVVSPDEIHSVERKVGTVFPASFVAFISACGAVYTPEILDLVVAAQESGQEDFEGWDVAKFFFPPEIPTTHALYVKGGMDDSVIPFASDSSGNVFGFRRSTACAEEAEVLFFDHDFCEVHVEATTFDGWIARFLKL